MVLGQMLKYDKISRAEFDSLKVLPLGLDFHKEDHKEGIADLFSGIFTVIHDSIQTG